MRAPLWAAGPAARQGRSSVGPRRGAAWGCVGATQGRSVVRCTVAAVRGGARSQQCGAAQGRSVGLRRGGGDTACTLGGGGGGCGLVRGCAREGAGGAVSSTAERRRVADRAEDGRGWPKSAGEPGALKVSGGPRSAVGPAPRSAGTNPAEHHPRGRILVEAGGSATPSHRGRTGPGRAPPEGYRGGGRGWAPVLRGPGPWWSWAGAGETGRASGQRLVRAPGGWARAPEGGRSLKGGGGLLPARAAQMRSVVRCRGAAVWGRAGVQRAAAQGCSVGPRRSAAWGRVWARHGAAQGRGAGLRRGAAWGRGGARHGAAHGRGMGPRTGVARGCAGAQRGAAQGRIAGPRMGAAWGRAGAQ